MCVAPDRLGTVGLRVRALAVDLYFVMISSLPAVHAPFYCGLALVGGSPEFLLTIDFVHAIQRMKPPGVVVVNSSLLGNKVAMRLVKADLTRRRKHL
jgi:hypothetical protein